MLLPGLLVKRMKLEVVLIIHEFLRLFENKYIKASISCPFCHYFYFFDISAYNMFNI